MLTAIAPAIAAYTTVTLTSHRRHRHNPTPVKIGFRPPSAAHHIEFGSLALAASIARTRTLASAPDEMLRDFEQSALLELKWLFKPGRSFRLTDHIDQLADSDRTGFAGRVGAGITDLYMNAMGYVWRDNAQGLSPSLNPHADFIYGGGHAIGHGVVLAEAFGSFSSDVSVGRIRRRADLKYKRQVKPHLGKTSAHGRVIHGYSIAFGSRPSVSGAYLGLSETQVPGAGRGTQPPMEDGDSPVSASLLLAAHRSNFVLMGAFEVTSWIDRVRRGIFRPDPAAFEDVRFLRASLDGRAYIFFEQAEPSFRLDLVARAPFGTLWLLKRESKSIGRWFALEERAAERFLNSLSAIIRSGGIDAASQIQAPHFAPVGLITSKGRSEERPSKASYVLFRDGLAFFDDPDPDTPFSVRVWKPKDGLGPLDKWA